MPSTKRKLQSGVGGGTSGSGTPVTYGSDGGVEDYRKKREKNNLAVKRSRVKAKTRTMETEKRVNSLRAKNQCLEEKIKVSKRKLTHLKQLFMLHATSTNCKIPEDDLKKIFEDDNDDEDDEDNVDNVTEDNNRNNSDEDDEDDYGDIVNNSKTTTSAGLRDHGRGHVKRSSRVR